MFRMHYPPFGYLLIDVVPPFLCIIDTKSIDLQTFSYLQEVPAKLIKGVSCIKSRYLLSSRNPSFFEVYWNSMPFAPKREVISEKHIACICRQGCIHKGKFARSLIMLILWAHFRNGSALSKFWGCVFEIAWETCRSYLRCYCRFVSLRFVNAEACRYYWIFGDNSSPNYLSLIKFSKFGETRLWLSRMIT